MLEPKVGDFCIIYQFSAYSLIGQIIEYDGGYFYRIKTEFYPDGYWYEKEQIKVLTDEDKAELL